MTCSNMFGEASPSKDALAKGFHANHTPRASFAKGANTCGRSPTGVQRTLRRRAAELSKGNRRSPTSTHDMQSEMCATAGPCALRSKLVACKQAVTRTPLPAFLKKCASSRTIVNRLSAGAKNTLFQSLRPLGLALNDETVTPESWAGAKLSNGSGSLRMCDIN